MVAGYQKTVSPGSPGKEREPAEPHAGHGKDGTCRCKETSEMTPRELLKLMFSDLTFWKKEKKG
jgi:hypothetical protein